MNFFSKLMGALIVSLVFLAYSKLNAQCTQLAPAFPTPQPGTCQQAINSTNLAGWFTACQTVCLNNTGVGASNQVSDMTCTGGSAPNDLWLYVNNPYANIPNYDGSIVFRFVDWPGKATGAKSPYFAAHVEVEARVAGIVVQSINCQDGFANENAICLHPDSISGAQFYAGPGTLPTLPILSQIASQQAGTNVNVTNVSYWMQLVTFNGAQGQICFEVSPYSSGFLCGDATAVSLTGNNAQVSGTASACLCQTALYGGLANIEHNLSVPCGTESEASAWFKINAPFACNVISATVSNWGGTGSYNVAILSGVNCPQSVGVNDFTGQIVITPGQVMNPGYQIVASSCGSAAGNFCSPLPAGEYYIYVSGETVKSNFNLNVTVSNAASASGTASSPQNSQNVCSGSSIELSTTGAQLPLSGTCGQDIAWYYSTNIAFNPYNNQGTYAASGTSNIIFPLPANTTCAPVTWYFKGIVSDDGTSTQAGCKSTTNTISVTVYPEIGQATILNQQCLIAVAPRCNSFTVNGNPGTATFAATFADDGSTQNFVISNGLPACNVVVSEVVSCSGNCTQPIATGTAACNANDPFNFYVNVNFSPGSAATYFITDNTGGMFPVSTAGTYQVGPYSNGTTVFITVENTDDPNCNLPLGAFTDDCNTLFCPNVVSATLSVSGNRCANTSVILQATLDQPLLVINQDYTIQWKLNGQPIPGANTLVYQHTFETSQGCGPEVQEFSVSLTCLMANASPSTMPNRTAGQLVIYPRPQLGVDFTLSPNNCDLAPVDNCGALNISYTPLTNPTPGSGPTTVTYTATVPGAPAGCNSTGTYVVNCPDCSGLAGDATTAPDHVVCHQESFTVSASGASLPNGFARGFAVTTSNPYSNLNAAINTAIQQNNVIGPDNGTPVYNFTAGVDYGPGDFYFIPFLSLDVSNTTPAHQVTGSFSVSAPFQGNSVTLTVPQIPYCQGVTAYNINLTVTQTNNTGNLNAIDAVSGTFFTYSGSSTTSLNLNNNNYTANPSGGTVTINGSGNLFWGGNISYTLTINYAANYSFPRVCPGCNDVGLPQFVKILPDIILTPAPLPNICDGASFDLTTINPSSNVSGTFAWYNGNPQTGGTLIPDPTDIIPINGAQYYAVFEADDDSTCTKQLSYTINTTSPPALNPIPPQNPVCLGQTVNLLSLQSGITAQPGTFIWYKGDPDQGGVRLVQGIAQNLQPIDGQLYFAVFTSFSTGCSNKVSVSFQVLPLPVLNPVFPPNVCTGGTFDLTTLESTISTDPGSFVWFNGNPQSGGTQLTPAQAAAVSPTASSTFYAVFTNPAGCSAQAAITFNVYPLPVLSQPAPQSLCSGTVVDLTAFEPNIISTAGTFTWYLGNPNTTGIPVANPQAVTPANGNVFFVVFTDAITGCQNMTSVAYTVTASPVLNSIPPQQVCQGSVVNLNDFNPLLTSANGFYQWYVGDPDTGGTALNAVQAGAQVPSVGQTNYVVVFTGFPSGCESKSVVVYTVHPNPVLDSIPDPGPLCAGTRIDLTAYDSVLTNLPGTVQWYQGNPATGGILLSAAQAADIVPIANTAYFAVFTQAGTGCIGQTFHVFNMLSPLAGITASYDCSIDQLVVNLTNASGGTGSGYAIDPSSPAQPGQSYPNGFQWRVYVVDSIGCSDTLRGTVNCLTCTAGSAALASAQDSLCCGETIKATVSGFTTGPNMIAWAVTPLATGPVTNATAVQTAHAAGRVFLANPDFSMDFTHNCSGLNLAPGDYYLTPFIAESATSDSIVYDTLIGCRPFAEICPTIGGTTWEMNPMIMYFPDGDSININQEFAFGLPIDSVLLSAFGGLPCIALTDLFKGNPNGTWAVSIKNTGTGPLAFNVPDFQVTVSADSCAQLGGVDQVSNIAGINGTIQAGQSARFEFLIPNLPGGFPTIVPNCEAYGDPIVFHIKTLEQCIDFVPEIRAEDVAIFPNPTTGQLFVQLQHPALTDFSIMVHSIVGKELYRKDVRYPSFTTQTLELGHLSDGLYFVTLQTATGQRLVFRVVKNN